MQTLFYHISVYARAQFQGLYSTKSTSSKRYENNCEDYSKCSDIAVMSQITGALSQRLVMGQDDKIWMNA